MTGQTGTGGGPDKVRKDVNEYRARRNTLSQAIRASVCSDRGTSIVLGYCTGVVWDDDGDGLGECGVSLCLVLVISSRDSRS